MCIKRPLALTVAGYDPSGGAGLLADIKTFEALQVYGMGVQSALTFQNEKQFEAVQWTPVLNIIKQLEVLFRRHSFSFVKLGLIEGKDALEEILLFLKKKNPQTFVVWDPVLKASAGYSFHQQAGKWSPLLQHIGLITPNWEEARILWPGFPDLWPDPGQWDGNILLKGGHNQKEKGTDWLISPREKQRIQGKPFKGKEKHGTGCILSSAITAFLAHGFSLPQACQRAKDYVEHYMLSTTTLLGYHQYQPGIHSPE